jgi:hypothetical protein
MEHGWYGWKGGVDEDGGCVDGDVKQRIGLGEVGLTIVKGEGSVAAARVS